jgi:predicted alpha/beta hydrolase
MTLVATADDPIPDGAVCEWHEAADGTRIRMARFHRPSATRGTVVLLNGRTEFIEKYFEVIGDLLSRGFAVATLDWRGQGLSDRALTNPHKGHVADFSLYIDDLQRVVEDFVLVEDFQFISLTRSQTKTLHGLGGGLEIETEMARNRFGRLALTFGAHVYHVLGDRRFDFTASDGEHTARWKATLDPLVYRFGVGFRFRFLPD